MSNDSVTTAFAMILEEIDSVVTEVNSQGAAFLRNNDYPKARASIESGEKLAAFRSKLDSLKNEWVSGLDEPTRMQVQVESSEVAKHIASAPKSSKTILVIKFQDGTILFDGVAADTFSKAIQKFGIQRVSDLGLQVNAFPLISKQRSYMYSQTEIDGYLIMTHSSTEAKRSQILKIAEMLNESVSVDVVPA
jgi:hypothetical protein